MATTLTSVQSPLMAAIAAAILADIALAKLLAGDKVYSLTAPLDTPPPYLVLGNATASGFYTFARTGESTTLMLHVWTAGVDSAQALAIYAELFRVLDLKPLALAGHVLLYGPVSLTTVGADPAGELVHLVAQYKPTTLPT
jgi:hypothetical protein